MKQVLADLGLISKVSTMASGDIKHYIEETDITMMCMLTTHLQLRCFAIDHRSQIPSLILQE